MERFNEVLKENRTRYQMNKRRIEQAQKRQQIKEWCLFTFIAAFILVMLFMSLCKIDNRSMKNCMEAGYSQYVCEKNM